DNRTTPDFYPVPHDRTEFSESGRNQSGFALNANFFAIQSNVRKYDSGSKGGFVADHRIPDVIEMWYLGIIKDDAVFEFARISKDGAIADDHIFPDITTASDLAVVSDPGRTFNCRPVLDQSSVAHIHIFTNERTAHNATVDCGLQAKLKIASNLLERVPHIGAVIKYCAVFCLVKVKEFSGCKHS